MNLDDVIYISLLIFSILFGHVFCTIRSLWLKQAIATAIGCLIVLLVSGIHTLHPLFATVFTIFILKYVDKRIVHKVSFVFLFSYLLFFRLCHYIGLPMTPPHTNAIQMILTLKLVGLCFEVHDTWQKVSTLKKETSKDEEKLKLELKYEEVDPSAYDVFHYAFCYVGVLTGPYFKYRVYRDMITADPHKQISYFDATIKRIKFVPLYAVLFLLSGYFFPLSFAESNEIFSDYSFMFRVWYMTPVFFTFRMRIYVGFVLSECACIMAGLGAYPVEAQSRPGKGPTNYEALEKCTNTAESVSEVDFETIHNIDEYGSEFTPTVRAGMKCWNMTVQYWLAFNIYKRMSLPKPIKEVITMFTSAFWHGVYPGYYLSMLTVPFILAVEDYYERVLRRKLSQEWQRTYDWFAWVLKMQHFSYMGMAFLLLRVDATLHYWKSIGFIFHGFIVIMHGFAQFVNLINYKATKKLEKCYKTTRVGDSRISYKKLGSQITKESDKEKKHQ